MSNEFHIKKQLDAQKELNEFMERNRTIIDLYVDLMNNCMKATNAANKALMGEYENKQQIGYKPRNAATV